MSGTFRLSPEPLIVKWPVKVSIPTNGGTTAVHKFYLHFKIEDTDALRKALPGNTLESALESDDGEDRAIQFLTDHIADWEGIKTADGDGDAEFNPDTLHMLLTKPWAISPIAAAYFECAAGRKAKN